MNWNTPYLAVDNYWLPQRRFIQRTTVEEIVSHGVALKDVSGMENQSSPTLLILDTLTPSQAEELRVLGKIVWTGRKVA